MRNQKKWYLKYKTTAKGARYKKVFFPFKKDAKEFERQLKASNKSGQDRSNYLIQEIVNTEPPIKPIIRYKDANTKKFVKAPTTPEQAKNVIKYTFKGNEVKITKARPVKPKPPQFFEVQDETLGSSIPDFVQGRNKAKSYQVIDLQGKKHTFFSVEGYLNKINEIHGQVGQIKKLLQEKGGLKETYLGWVTPTTTQTETIKGELVRFRADYSQQPFKRVAPDKWNEYKNKFFN